jgi:hypothetical protein
VKKFFIAWALVYLSVGCGKMFTRTGLLNAAKTNDTNYITSYVRAGKDVNVPLALGPGNHRFTYLIHEAARHGQFDVFVLLLKAGANPLAADSAGSTSLDAVLCSEMSLGGKACFDILVTNRNSVNAYNKTGDTPLVSAVRYQDYAIVRTLLANGADPNLRDAMGKSPLHLTKDPRVAKALLEAGANPELRDFNGLTAIQSARKEGRTLVEAAMLDWRASRLDLQKPGDSHGSSQQ